MAYLMSAPNLMVWLPLILVQLVTHWNCCSLSVSGQLQRPTPNPSPQLTVEAPLKNPPFADEADGVWFRRKPPHPEVVAAVLPGIFALGIPAEVIGVAPTSGFDATGLYLKYPKRKSAILEKLNVLV